MAQLRSEELESLSTALYSLHFRALETMHVDWVKAKPVAVLPAELEPMGAVEAGEALMLALDKLKDSDQRQRLNHIHAHAAAIVVWALHWGGSRTPSLLPELGKAYSRLMAGRTELEKLASPIETYLEQLRAFQVAECVESFDLKAVYDLDLEHTTVTVDVIVKRLVADYATLVDPQNWSLTAPVAFTASYVVDGDPPDDLDVDPPEAPRANSPWKKLLFEAARLAFSAQGALTLSKFRNILHINYQADVSSTVAEPKIDVDYRLIENLTQRVLQIPSLGGIDKDSGTITVKSLDAIRSSLYASKSFRFVAPPGLRTILNWMNLPFLVTWMLFYVVAGACAPPLKIGEDT